MAKSTRRDDDEAPETQPRPSKRPFGGGYLRDSHDDKDFSSHAMLGAARSLPAECLGLRAHLRRIKNQANTSSCVGQALCTAIDVRLRSMGLEPVERSSSAAYAFGRKAGGEKVLHDSGSYPRSVMKAASAVGIPAEEAWPFDPAKINDEPPLELLGEAAKFLLLRWYRVYASGASRATELANALSKGYPFIFGLELDSAFFEYKGGVIRAMGPDAQGGHMLCCVGYRTGEDGKREFMIVNSWGEGWGEAGICWIGEDVMASDRVSDPYVVEVSP